MLSKRAKRFNKKQKSVKKIIKIDWNAIQSLEFNRELMPLEYMDSMYKTNIEPSPRVIVVGTPNNSEDSLIYKMYKKMEKDGLVVIKRNLGTDINGWTKHEFTVVDDIYN